MDRRTRKLAGGVAVLVACALIAVSAVGLPNAGAQGATPGVTIDELGGLAVSETGPTTDTYTVVLDTAPTATVTVTVTADADALVSNGGPFSGSTTLAFDSTDWNTPKTVTVQAVDDPTAEGSPHTATITHTASSSDGNYNGLTIASATADVTDNDNAGVTIDEGGGLAVSETAPTTDTYTVVLDTPPTANVTVTATADADVLVSTDNVTFTSSVMLTFTNGTWNTSQTVYVQAVDDNIDEPSPHTATITHTASSSDAPYNGLAIADATADVTDNDLASLTVNNGGGVAVDEATPLVSDSYTLTLGSEPSATETITVTADAQTLVSTDNVNFAASKDLSFTAANYSTPHTVYVRAVDDQVVESSPHNSTHTLSSSGAPEYAFVTGITRDVSVSDNDTADVIVTPTTVSATEGGANGSYSIVLGSQPTSDVTVSFSNVNGEVAAISAVTFTPANWNVAKTITVQAVDDGAVEGAHSDTIQHTITSSDGNYNGFAASDVTVNITDDDSFAVVLVQSGGSTDVSEAGASDTYTLQLDSQPANDVTISFATGTQIQPIGSVTFTPANWNLPQTITVRAVDDDVDEPSTHTGTIQHTVSSTDGNFNGLPVPDVTANITDNDSAGVGVTPTSVNVAENGATATYSIVLQSRPAADVTISFGTGSQLAPIPDFTFTPANWNVPHTVTVAAVADPPDEGTHNATVSHTATSGDPLFNNVAIPAVAVTIADVDNCPSVANPDQQDFDGNGIGTVCDPFELRPGRCANERIGTDGPDTIAGTVAGDLIAGLAADDTLVGNAGDDCIDGGDGDDELYGHDGADQVEGGDGNDRVSGGTGDDGPLRGQAGNDFVIGGPGSDNLSGGAGDDRLSGGSGADVITGGSGDDRLRGGDGRNRYFGSSGDDAINAANGVRETVDCGTGRDRAIVDPGDTTRSCERVARR